MTTPAGTQPEPWLREPNLNFQPVRAVLHAFELAQEDVRHWTPDFSEADLHAATSGLAPIAFHLRHIPRSLNRLLTYAEGNQLSVEQISALKSESAPGVTREDLFAEFDGSRKCGRTRARLCRSGLDQPRGVGKKQLRTSVGGLLVHLADHTQRHTGQIVTTSKAIKATNVEEMQAVYTG